MLPTGLIKLPSDTGDASPHRECNGQANLQKAILIKSTKYAPSQEKVVVKSSCGIQGGNVLFR